MNALRERKEEGYCNASTNQPQITNQLLFPLLLPNAYDADNFKDYNTSRHVKWLMTSSYDAKVFFGMKVS